MTELRWNDIPGLTLQEQEWMDNLAHGGPVAREIVEWVTKLLIDRSRTPDQFTAQDFCADMIANLRHNVKHAPKEPTAPTEEKK